MAAVGIAAVLAAARLLPGCPAGMTLLRPAGGRVEWESGTVQSRRRKVVATSGGGGGLGAHLPRRPAGRSRLRCRHVDGLRAASRPQ